MNMMNFNFSKKHEDFMISGLRISIAIIFLWFGFLKVFGYNPVSEIVFNSMFPVYVSGMGLFALGTFEIIIGLLLISNSFLTLTYGVILLHLVGTFTAFIFGWDILFSPHFPILTISGEFVMKNLVLIFSSLVMLVHEKRKQQGGLQVM